MATLDQDFENSNFIPDGASYPARWQQAAAAFRAAHPPQNIGGADLFLPDGAPKGLMVFVHGGYWIESGKSDWSHLAAGAIAKGWAVGVPSYVLAPDARIPDMVGMVASGVAALAGAVAGPMTLTGHSAGGHLAVRQICADSFLPAAVLDRIAACAPISGLFDLLPLIQTQMNDLLQLDTDVARAESPIHHRPIRPVPTEIWVGADERPEFLRQSMSLADAWRDVALPPKLIEVPGRHHFDIVDALTDPDHPLVAFLTPG